MKSCCYLIALTTAWVATPSLADDPSNQRSEPLVQRNRISLTLAGAEVALSAAQEKARELKLNVNITVVDEGGHPVAFARMDGARPASVYTSMTKATSAATSRSLTGPLPPGQPTNAHLSLAVESAAHASGGKFTTLKGGVPIIIDDQVIGAVGVGGATGEQDAMIAEAGVEALAQAVKKENGSPR